MWCSSYIKYLADIRTKYSLCGYHNIKLYRGIASRFINYTRYTIIRTSIIYNAYIYIYILYSLTR